MAGNVKVTTPHGAPIIEEQTASAAVLAAVRGLAFEFCTEESNWNLAGNKSRPS